MLEKMAVILIASFKYPMCQLEVRNVGLSQKSREFTLANETELLINARLYMEIPRHSQSQGFEKARQGMRAFSQFGEIPNLEGTGTRALEAWFLGTKAENADVLEGLIVEAVRDQAFWRRNFHPGDPSHITAEMRRSPEYLEAMDSLEEGYYSLLGFLKKSVPFFSMRYQGHMNWDLRDGSEAGYTFTALR